VEGARGFQAGFDSMHPAHAEVDYLPSLRRLDDPCRLRPQNRLKVDMVHHNRFDQLCFGDWGGNFDDWFRRKDRRPLRHREHVAGEVKLLEVAKEAIGEAAQRRQVPKGGVIELQRLQKVEDILQAAGEKKIAALGQSTHEQAEDGDIAHLLFEVRLEHRELV
jgi:hypothetical protein